MGISSLDIRARRGLGGRTAGGQDKRVGGNPLGEHLRGNGKTGFTGESRFREGSSWSVHLLARLGKGCLCPLVDEKGRELWSREFEGPRARKGGPSGGMGEVSLLQGGRVPTGTGSRIPTCSAHGEGRLKWSRTVGAGRTTRTMLRLRGRYDLAGSTSSWGGRGKGMRCSPSPSAPQGPSGSFRLRRDWRRSSWRS